MRLHLVSLALLLLALCRSSSAGLGYSVVSKNTQSSTSSIAFTKPEQSKKVTEESKKVTEKLDDAKKIEKIMDLIGNTIFTLGFEKAGILRSMQKEFVMALVNGVICELKPKDKINDEIVKIQGGDPADQHKKELEALPADLCTKTETVTEHKNAQNCICNEKKTFIYCSLYQLPDILREMGFPEQPCRDVAINEFRDAGKDLFQAYDLDNFGTDKYTDFFKGNVDGVSKTAAAMFCDALNPKVEAAVKKLYAADAMYWIAESVMYTIVFGEPGTSLAAVCQEPDFANNEYGKCVCEFKTGFSFCIYKVFAQYFKKEKYLKCPSTEEPEILVAEYVADHKPTAPPPKLAQRGSASPNSAATSSVLLAPLTAAAAMLLRL